MEDAQEEEEVENNAREADDVEGKDKRVQETKVCNKYRNIDDHDQSVRGDEDQSWSQETWPSVVNTKDENAGNNDPTPTEEKVHKMNVVVNIFKQVTFHIIRIFLSFSCFCPNFCADISK